MHPRFPRRSGFTLVELLVVIVIIAVLASLSFMMVNRGLKRAEGAKAVSNLRQIGNMMGSFAADNGNRLPPGRADIRAGGSGNWQQLHWYEALLSMIHSDMEPATWRNVEWWEQTKPVLLNPLIDDTSRPNRHAWWNPGYALNRQIVSNLAPSGIGSNWTAGDNGPQTYAIPLAAIPEPARTPMVAPRADWHFTYNPTEIREVGLTQFLVNDQMPILFIDGHVESMPLAEYTERKLHEMPRR